MSKFMGEGGRGRVGGKFRGRGVKASSVWGEVGGGRGKKREIREIAGMMDGGRGDCNTAKYAKTG